MRLLLFLLSFFLVSCAQPKQEERTVSLTDDLGRTLQLPGHPKTVMALAPSATEMLALVAEPGQLIGRTSHCNFPDWVKARPAVNVYPLDIERLLQLKPDLVLTVEGMTSLENAQKLQELGIPVFYQKFEKVTDVLNGLTKIGEILNRQQRARHVTDSLRSQLAEVEKDFNPKKRMPGVIALAWQDPILVYGRNTLFTDKIMRAGGYNAIDTAFSNPFPPITREHLLKLNPDVIISRSFEEMDTTFFRLYPELRALKAYQSKRIFAVNPDLMERPGPRVVESVKELQQLLNK